MFARRLSRCFALLALLAWSAGAAAQTFWTGNPNLRWRTLHSDHFAVHFSDARREEARLVAAIAEKLYPRVTGQLGWEPRSATHILLLDSLDLANGFATPLPFNYSGIFLTPPDDGELLQNREWLEMVLVHELTHIVHIDKARGMPLALRNVFGRLWPSFPNAIQPTWIIEGLAVFSESDASLSYGRLGNTHFDGMMRAEVARGLRSLAEINADGRGFPLNRNYLYGGYFFAFLRERYSDAAIIEFVNSYSGKLFWFPVDSNPESATGKTMTELWEEYHDWLQGRFAPKSDTASHEGEILARHWTVFSPVLSPNGDRWYIQGNGYTLPDLMRQARDGKASTVRETEGETRAIAFGADSVLLSQLEVCDNYNIYYDLYRVDARGSRKRLTECSRNRFAAPLDDGRIVAVRLLGVTAEVVLLDAAGKTLRTLYRAAPAESIVGLAAKQDVVVISTLRGGQWSLVDVGGGQPVVLLSDSSIKHSPRFGASSDQIFFIADYGKVYNVWSLNRGARSLQRWTQATNGVREMSAPVDGEILLVTIEADGDALRSYRLPAEPLERRASAVATPGEARAEMPFAGEDVPYSPWSSLRPHAWVPILDLADGMFAVGAAVFGMDALGLHQYYVAPLYEVTQNELLGAVEYLYDYRHGFSASRTMTVKATNSDETEIRRYRIKEDVQWVSTWRHLALNRRFYWGLGAAVDQEKDYEVDGATTPLVRQRVAALVAGVDTRRQQYLSEGPSQGQWLRLFVETSQKLKADYDGNVVRADWRAHLPISRSVLSLRWNEGYGTSSAQPFELGGSKSDEYILLPRLNERSFALRGYTSGEASLIGHRSRVVTAEWRVPLADLDRHAMTPPAGINRLSLNAFYDLGAAWEHGGSPDYHRGFGIELLAEPRLIYVFGWQFRAGVAKGLDQGGETKVYLHTGRSF
jgi:hypothetical protein